MLIVNGFLKIGKSTGGGIDADGYPAAAAVEYGDPVPCQWLETLRDNLAKSEGEPLTTRAYTIYLELPSTVARDEKVALYGIAGECIGEFSVISATVLRAVNQLKITV